MTITSLVVISSKYKTEDSRSTTDFTYSIGQSLEVSAVAIKSISIPNLQYNINSRNNTLLVFYSGSSATITLPEGQYDLDTFIASLQALIATTVGDTLTITQNVLTSKLNIIMNTVPIKISTDPILSPLAKVVGLGDTSGSTFPTVAELSLTCPNLPNLGGLKNYYVTSRVLSQGYNGVFKGGDQIPLLMNVPVTVAYGVVEHYEPQDIHLNLKKFVRKQNIQWIDIKIFDEDLNVINLNGGDIEIVLKIYSTDSPLNEK